MEKLSRNAPCHCGTGRKYKKCCLPKENKIMQENMNNAGGSKPKNTFREEIERELKAKPIQQVELIRRDQRVMLLELECRSRMSIADKAHVMVGISELKVHRIEIANQPACETKASALEGIDKQIEILEQQAEQCKISRITELTIEALRVALGITEEAKALVDDDGDTGLPSPVATSIPENQKGKVVA